MRYCSNEASQFRATPHRSTLIPTHLGGDGVKEEEEEEEEEEGFTYTKWE